MAVKTVAVTDEQYKNIITALYTGTSRSYPSPAIATILQIEANTGIRIGDVLNLKRGDILRDGDKYRFDIVEQKTGKKRDFLVPVPVYNLIERYCIQNNIEPGHKIFNMTVRSVQRKIENVCKPLGYEEYNISTHSFRKYFGTKAYINSGYDIELVKRLFQHSSSAITSRYIGITDKKTEDVLNSMSNIVEDAEDEEDVEE